MNESVGVCIMNVCNVLVFTLNREFAMTALCWNNCYWQPLIDVPSVDACRDGDCRPLLDVPSVDVCRDGACRPLLDAPSVDVCRDGDCLTFLQWASAETAPAGRCRTFLQWTLQVTARVTGRQSQQKLSPKKRRKIKEAKFCRGRYFGWEGNGKICYSSKQKLWNPISFRQWYAALIC
jgi:hypothetical protein